MTIGELLAIIGTGGIAAVWQARAAIMRAQGQNKTDFDAALTEARKQLDAEQCAFRQALREELDKLRDENSRLQGRIDELSRQLAITLQERNHLYDQVCELTRRLDELQHVTEP